MTKGEFVDAAVAGLQSAPRNYRNLLQDLSVRKEVLASKHFGYLFFIVAQPL